MNSTYSFFIWIALWRMYVFRQQLKIHKYQWSWNELYLAWKFCNVQRNAIRERPHIIYKLLVRNCMNNTILIHSDTLCKWNVVIQVKYKACTLKKYVITCTSSFICKIISQFNCYMCKLFKFECKKKSVSKWTRESENWYLLTSLYPNGIF